MSTQHAPTDAEKAQRLPWLIAGDGFNIVFVLLTFSGSVFILFLDELGLNTGQIGIVLSLVPFCGVVAPLVAPLTTRFGYKRTFVLFRGLRNIPMMFLLLTPLVLAGFGSNGAFVWVSIFILFFAVMRGIGETGGHSWRKDIVPDSIRGKFSATASMTTTIISIVVVLTASYVIENGVGLQRFIVLMAVGILFGISSVLIFSRAPAEDRSRATAGESGHLAAMRDSLRDRGFVLFMVVLSIATIGEQAANSFTPLFMKEEVGLSEGLVVLLSMGNYIGALITSYFWGWAADRYSSKPVMQVSLILMLLIPISWLLLPRNNPASAPLAMSVAFISGIAVLAWQISWTRHLFVNAVPAQNRTAYLAVYFAWLSIVVGLGPLLTGRLLTLTAAIPTMQIGLIHIDSYTPLWIISISLFLITMMIVPRLRTEHAVTFRRFAGMFLRGNPVRAMRLLIQYNQSGDEMTTLVATEQMGDTQNLLNTEELIEALNDPSYNVRYEAIHSIGRMPSTPELREALVAILDGPESELGMATARALERMGDPEAIPALRRSLHSRYDLIAAESARALAGLNDEASIPDIQAQMRAQQAPHLRAAYATALGKLRAVESVPELFQMLCEADVETQRGEIGLAIARIVGDEKYYLQQWRALHRDYHTATAQALIALRRQASRGGHDYLDSSFEMCVEYFGTGETIDGVDELQQMLQSAADSSENAVLQDALIRCSAALVQCGDDRLDLVLLSLHLLDAAIGQTG
ncbi:MAG: MFS transporter [Caldilineales bacterium]|nr:MFS transporter [Caldilineales bacterium]